MGLSPKLIPASPRVSPVLIALPFLTSTAAASLISRSSTPPLSPSYPPSFASPRARRVQPRVNLSEDDEEEEGEEAFNDNSPPLVSSGAELATPRRRAGGALRADEYESLPHYNGDGGPLLSARGAPSGSSSISMTGHYSPSGTGGGGGGSSRSKIRFRTIVGLLVVAIITLVLAPASNRQVAHDMLTSAGVPLPDRLISDRLHDLFESWESRYDGDGSDDLTYVPPPLHEDELKSGEEEWTTPHTFNPNGHLILQPLANFTTSPTPHPILLLIQRAQSDWSKKVNKQSRSLKAAAQEYRRRYAKNPPKGFDQWWAYAKANKVIMTDEYDQIHKDLSPFFAL